VGTTSFWNSLHQVQYSQRHTMVNHCDRRITDLSDTDIFFVLFNNFFCI